MSSAACWPGLQVRVLAVFREMQFPYCRKSRYTQIKRWGVLSVTTKSTRCVCAVCGMKRWQKRWMFGFAQKACLFKHNSRRSKTLLDHTHPVIKTSWWREINNLGMSTLFFSLLASENWWCVSVPPLLHAFSSSLVPGFFFPSQQFFHHQAGHHGYQSPVLQKVGSFNQPSTTLSTWQAPQPPLLLTAMTTHNIRLKSTCYRVMHVDCAMQSLDWLEGLRMWQGKECALGFRSAFHQAILAEPSRWWHVVGCTEEVGLLVMFEVDGTNSFGLPTWAEVLPHRSLKEYTRTPFSPSPSQIFARSLRYSRSELSKRGGGQRIVENNGTVCCAQVPKPNLVAKQISTSLQNVAAS